MTEEWVTIVIAAVFFVAVFVAGGLYLVLSKKRAAKIELNRRSTNPLDISRPNATQMQGAAEQSRLLIGGNNTTL